MKTTATTAFDEVYKGDVLFFSAFFMVGWNDAGGKWSLFFPSFPLFFDHRLIDKGDLWRGNPENGQETLQDPRLGY